MGQLEPVRKHFGEVLKRLALTHSESKRTARLRHSSLRPGSGSDN